MGHGPAISPFHLGFMIATGLVAIGPLAAQTASLRPVAPPKLAIPERIDPIVAPLPAAPPVASRPANTTAARLAPAPRGSTVAGAAAKRPTCAPAERLQRKTGVCQAILSATPKLATARAAPTKPAALKSTASKPGSKTVPKSVSQAKPAKASAKKG